METLYKEMQERLRYLEAQEENDENRYRIMELTLAIVRIQQLLLASVSSSKNYTEPSLKRLDPLTDEQKRAIFGVNVELMTIEDALERYGDHLTDEEKLRIRSMK